MAASARVNVSVDVLDRLNADAIALDLDTAVLASAVIEGALKVGQIERLASIALADRRTKRRQRRRLRWDRIDGTGVGTDGPCTWTHDAWTLTYLGDHFRSRNPEPGQGWYLDGPGEPPGGTLLATRRGEATMLADERIGRYKANEGGGDG